MSISYNRIYWLDSIKGVCMLCVYIKHCIAYYNIGTSSTYFWVTPFYVSAFFFVSGYLYIPKCLEKEKLSLHEFWKIINNVFIHIIIPTLCFSTLVYFPKMLYNNSDMSVITLISDVFLGKCFWFTSAMAVAQIIILFSVLSLKIKNEWNMCLITLLYAFIGFLISKDDTGISPWFYKSGMLATFFMSLGALYRRYENIIESMISTGKKAILSLCLYFLFLFINNDKQILCGNIGLNYNFLGWVATFIGISMILYCCKAFPKIKFLSFIGQNALTFYFLSGILPASISTLALKILHIYNWYVLYLVYIVVISLASIAVLIINKYLRFLLDIRTINS